MARVFFLSGQTQDRRTGDPVNFDVKRHRHSRSCCRPRSSTSTFQLFQTQYADLPYVRRHVAAYIFTYAEFVLPICLVLGFATRLCGAGAAGHDGADRGLRHARRRSGRRTSTGSRSCWCCMSVGPGRDLARRADPVYRRSYRSRSRLRIYAGHPERWGHEFRQRQRGRHRAGNPRRDRARQRRRRARLRQRRLDQARRAALCRDLRARGRGVPGADRDGRECAGARASDAALGRGAVPRRVAHRDRRMRRAGVLRRRHQADRPCRARAARSRPRRCAPRSTHGQWGGPHHVSPAVLSLSQATEAGTIYRADEIRALADIAHARGLARAHGRRAPRATRSRA